MGGKSRKKTYIQAEKTSKKRKKGALKKKGKLQNFFGKLVIKIFLEKKNGFFSGARGVRKNGAEQPKKKRKKKRGFNKEGTKEAGAET